ncbi:MAG TPA: MXAN_5187 C-terminal domain-containing protein, partial [Myxococcota bacterium]|nr:MXAN_5187 C-terminal domain-containing protein [Myxococcota bacterium]
RVLRQIEAGTWKRTRGRDAILEENMPPAMRAARRRRERRLATIDARRMERGELPAGVHGEDVDVDDLELPPLPVIGADDWPDTPVSSGTPSSATPAVPRPHSTLVDDVRPTRRVIAAPGAIVSTKPPAAPPPPPSPVRVPLPRSAATTAAPLAPPMAPALPKAAATTAAPPAPPVAPALPKAAAPSAPPAAVIKPPALPPPPPAAALLARKPTVPPPSPSPAPSPSPPPSPPPSAATATAGATASVTAVRRPYERVFREFVEARKQAGQAGDVSYDNLEKTLKAQEEALRAQKKWSDVRFRVAIENGKAVVKAGRGDDKP